MFQNFEKFSLYFTALFLFVTMYKILHKYFCMYCLHKFHSALASNEESGDVLLEPVENLILCKHWIGKT